MESIKKNYKPKAEKVEKLKELYTQLSANAPKSIVFGKKVVKGLLIVFLFTGCSAQYHLKQALKKDSTIITTKVLKHIDTLVIRESYSITDTFTTRVLDTIIIEDEGVKTVVYRNHDIIRVKTVVKGDTIKVRQTIYKPMVKIKECQHNWLLYVICLIGFISALLIVLKK